MASSSKFSLLPSNYLASQPPQSEITLPNLLETSQRLADDAREALPYSFDQCTYSKGYLRQSVWSCIDCGGKGVCYGCSISCHGEHQLVELWTRRHFQCDCPTGSQDSSDLIVAGPSSKRRKCTLNPPEIQPAEANIENRYGRNFKGEFCRCGRVYNAETEQEAMVVCIGCEDWFHESCLNLRPPVESSKPLEGQNGHDYEDDEEDDDNALIPSDTYDGLICAHCVTSNSFLLAKAGQPGFMVIEPTSDGWRVLGRAATKAEEKAVDGTEVVNGSDNLEEIMVDGRENSDHAKREADGEDEVRPLKKARLESECISTATERMTLKGKGDIFLSDGVREQLKMSLSPDVIANLPFPLGDQEIYEPAKDDDQEETIEEVTERVVGSLPRVQAIEALHGYQTMKDKLKTMLTARAESNQTVSKEDIDDFFEELRRGRGG